MSPGRTPSSAATRRRRSWSVFWVAAALALGGCLAAASRSGSSTDVGLVVLGGTIVVGIAAALLSAALSPFPDHALGARGAHGAHGAWHADGHGVDAGGHGGGDGGGACA